MQKVLVTVVGTQTNEYGEESRIELVAQGTSHQKDGIYYCTYQDSEVSGMEGTTSLLKVYKEHVVLIRKGAVGQTMEFLPGQKSDSSYITAYGTIEISVFTKHLAIVRTAGCRSLNVTYELEVNGQWQSSNTLSVNIQEEKLDECQGITRASNS